MARPVPITDFQNLAPDQKENLIFNKGMMLVVHEGSVLYSLFDYYIEMKIGQSGITAIDAFEEGDRLKSFLKKLRPD